MFLCIHLNSIKERQKHIRIDNQRKFETLISLIKQQFKLQRKNKKIKKIKTKKKKEYQTVFVILLIFEKAYLKSYMLHLHSK